MGSSSCEAAATASSSFGSTSSTPTAPPPEFLARFQPDLYLAEIAHMDSQVGRVLDELRRLGLREKTLVVLTADHGEGRGEHGELSHCYFIYQTTMAAPLIFWGPRELKPGQRIESPVRTTEITPTVLDLLGLPPLDGVQGVSLRQLANGQQREIELISYGESFEMQRSFATSPLRSVREGDWKYIHKVNPELYDLARDPRELTNLAEREPERVAYFQNRLEELLSEAEAPQSNSMTQVDDATQAQLAALGYTAPVAVSPIENEVASLAVAGADPATKASDVEDLSSALGYLGSGKYDIALAKFERLLERSPESAHIMGLKGRVHEELGQMDEAEVLYRRAIEVDPDSTRHRNLLAPILYNQGRVDEALEIMMSVVEREPCSRTGLELARRLHARKEYERQLDVLSRAVEGCPVASEHHNDYAWALATIPDAKYRDGAKAVEMARRGIELLTEEPGPAYLDTLATALAESGDFPRAISEIDRAIAKARRQGDPKVVLDILAGHRALFEQGRVPYE